MFRSKSHFLLLPISVVSVLILVCLIARQHAPGRSESVNESPTQNASGILLEAALTKSASTEAPGQDRLRIEAAYSNLQLSFEPNQGQTESRVKFLSRASNRTLWLTADEAVLAVGRPARANSSGARQAPAAKAANSQTTEAAPAVLRMKFVGANANPKMTGEARQSGTVNYFTGKPDQWRTKIPTYSRVRYRSLYPGIDLVFYGNNRELEYDLVVSPGADPGKIRLAVGGAKKINIDAEGNLVLETSAGDVIQQKPKIYQRKGANLTPVAGEYVITGKNEVGFRLGNYDRRAAVVIDPVLRYASYLTGGGDEDDVGTGIAVDSSNRVVVSGWTFSLTFPGENGPEPKGLSAFVTKLDFTGSQMIFTAFVASSVFFDNVPLALDAADNIYMAGSTNGNTFGDDPFKPTPGAFQGTFGGKTDAWVVKLNSSGTKLIYATYLGGSGGDQAESFGNPATAGTVQPVPAGGEDAFVTQISGSGSHLNYSTFLGGTGADGGNAIALDSFGNAFVTGRTRSANFPVKSAFQLHCSGDCIFVSKLNTSGRLVYSTFLGNGSGTAIAVTPLGEAYAAGDPGSNFQTTQTAFQRVGAGIFITKLSPTGQLIYSTLLGNGVIAPAIALDRNANAYLTGEVGFPPFATIPVTPGAFQVQRGAELDAFVAKVVAGCPFTVVNRTVTICSPVNGSTVKSPVHIVSGTKDLIPVRLTQVYVDGKKIYKAPLSSIEVNLPIPSGTHRLAVQALDTAGVFFSKTITINVRAQ